MAFTAKLLINGESVDGAGESLAVQRTLPPEAQFARLRKQAEQVEAAVRAAREA